jgi:hypothetical protein
MNYRARIERLERAARKWQERKAPPVKARFVYGGTPEAEAAEAEAKKRGEKVLRFDFGQGGRP